MSQSHLTGQFRGGETFGQNTYTLNFNDIHGVVVNGEDKHGQSRHIDETNTVGLSRYKVEGRVGVVVDQTGF
jgi:hypothetical protein